MLQETNEELDKLLPVTIDIKQNRPEFYFEDYKIFMKNNGFCGRKNLFDLIFKMEIYNSNKEEYLEEKKQDEEDLNARIKFFDT